MAFTDNFLRVVVIEGFNLLPCSKQPKAFALRTLMIWTWSFGGFCSRIAVRLPKAFVRKTFMVQVRAAAGFRSKTSFQRPKAFDRER